MFDEAVISRIHLAIPYPRADQERRQNIWKVLFKKLEADQKKRHATVDSGADIVKASLTGIPDQAGKAVQPRITIEDDTRLRFSVKKEDLDDEVRLSGREIRNGECNPETSKTF